jgi:hypothetical protein
MADNIKIVGNILNEQQILRYDTADINLLTAQTIQEDFGNRHTTRPRDDEAHLRLERPLL